MADMSQSSHAVRTDNYDVSSEEYLEYEREAFEKHEFISGEIVAMAGASENHNVISSNLIVEIGGKLKGTKCFAFASDMRVKAVKAKKSNYYYPDVVIVCGKREFGDDKKDVLINPKIVIEILSKSTKLKDRNEKLDSYMALETLTDYVLIEQDEMRIEHYSRIDADNWRVKLLSVENQTLSFETINCAVLLKDIYNEVEFETVSKKRKSSRKSQ